MKKQFLAQLSSYFKTQSLRDQFLTFTVTIIHSYPHCTCRFPWLSSLHHFFTMHWSILSPGLFPPTKISELQPLQFHKQKELNFYSCSDLIYSVRYFTNILANEFYAVKLRNSKLILFSLFFFRAISPNFLLTQFTP